MKRQNSYPNASPQVSLWRFLLFYTLVPILFLGSATNVIVEILTHHKQHDYSWMMEKEEAESEKESLSESEKDSFNGNGDSPAIFFTLPYFSQGTNHRLLLTPDLCISLPFFTIKALMPDVFLLTHNFRE